jgi:hypothetical protein
MGELLCARGLVSEAELEAALAEQRQTGQKLGEILVARGVITRLALASALSEQWHPKRGAGISNGRPTPPATAADAGSAPEQPASISVGEGDVSGAADVYETAEPEPARNGESPSPRLAVVATTVEPPAQPDDNRGEAAPNPAPPDGTSLVPRHDPKPPPVLDDAIQIVRCRYARGELTREQYLALLADLSL